MPQVATNASAWGDRLVRDPVYQQLNDLLQQLIRNGHFRPGQQFLTERQVSQRFGVSRVTANKALSHLVVAGLLEFRKGVGTFVRNGVLDYDLQSLMSFTRKAVLAGKQPETRVLRFQSQDALTAGHSTRAALKVTDAESLLYCERLRLADGEPVILERRHLVARLCPGLTQAQVEGSLYEVLTGQYGLRVTSASQTIQAVNLTGEDARLLQVPPGTAALRVRATGHAEAAPLWLEDTLYRGDRYEFHNAIGSATPPRPASLVNCGTEDSEDLS